MMRIVEGIHQCQIIHGDFKPDNLLVQDMYVYLLILTYIVVELVVTLHQLFTYRIRLLLRTAEMCVCGVQPHRRRLLRLDSDGTRLAADAEAH